MRVIIADDHQIVREGLAWMLESERTIEVVMDLENGRQVLDFVAADPEIDVILLDIRMPDMTGFDVLERLPADGPRVLIMSMHDEPAFIRRAFELGARGYLMKNSDRTELVEAIHRVGVGDVYVNGAAAAALVPNNELAGTDLSPRERQVLQLVAHGYENKQVARALDLSETTVKSYLKNVFARLGVSSRAEAVAVSLRAGIIE